MAIDEHDRMELFRRLEDVLGPEHASRLMASLPPMAWPDLMTKADGEALRQEIALSEARLLAEMHRQFTVHTRVFVVATTAAVFTSASLAFSAAALAMPG